MDKRQQGLFDHSKYQAFPHDVMPVRKWPDQHINHAPRWCSEDLRDGNQALINPLSVEQKQVFFMLLVKIGFKEIVLGFPSASQTDFDFVRLLIEQNLIPEDVTISILTPARDTLIERSFVALKGARKAIVHLYNSTSTVQREVVFKMSKDEIIQLAISGAEAIQQCAILQPETRWTFEYTPESFTATEAEYAVEICNAVGTVWLPTANNPVIFNLPSTVENTLPNVYADRIEWFSQHIQHREGVVLSVHTHNDRGSAIASAELALLAGAQRVEGTLLGNGERTGNADLLVMAMNLYSQGIDPELDFSAINEVAEVVSGFNNIALHPRHPYVGELVFTAFSGSHQDAIKKCLAAYQPGEVWNVAYLPINPEDIGRNYAEVVRINSQSGKGGSAYIIEQALGLRLPRWLQIEFGKLVQSQAEQSRVEISSSELVRLFNETYIDNQAGFHLVSFKLEKQQQDSIQAVIVTPTGEVTILGRGDGALTAFIDALQCGLNQKLEIIHYDEHALTEGTDATAICYIQVDVDGSVKTGVAYHNDIVSASVNAVLKTLT